MKLTTLLIFLVLSLGFLYNSFSKPNLDIDAQIKQEEQRVELLREKAAEIKTPKAFKDYAEAKTALEEMRYRVPQN